MHKPVLALVLLPSIAAATPFEYAAEPRTNAVLLDQSSTSTALTASTTKVMTMHLVLKAIAAGKLSLTDTVAMSPLAVSASCNCFPGGGTHVLAAGDYMSVDDALYGIALSTAEPTDSLAEMVANIDLYGVKASGSTMSESYALQNHFIYMMNAEATALALPGTQYSSVWGSQTNEWSTPRDLESLWVTSSNQSGFLTHMGMRSHTALVNQNGAWKSFNLGKSYSYFPNIVADKNGGWNGTTCCFVTQVSRGGRTVVASVLNSTNAFADQTATLRAAFATLMQPIAAGNGNQLSGGSTVGVATLNNQAATLQIAMGTLQVGAWTVDPASGDIALRGHATAKTAGTASADIAYPSSNYVVTAAETSSGIVLSGWTINASGTPAETTTLVVDDGSQPHLTVAGSIVVLAYLDAFGDPQVQSYKLGGGFTLVTSTSVPLSAYDLAIASSKTSIFGSYHDVMVASEGANGTQLDTFDVDPTTGALTHDSTVTTYNLKHLSLAATSFSRYALSGLDPVTKVLLVQFWSTDSGIAFEQQTLGYGDVMADAVVARLGADGVSALTVARDSNSHVRLSTWNVDPTLAPAPAVRMADADDAQSALDVAVAPLVDGAAATSYLVAEGYTGQVKLRVWRVGVK